MDNFTFSDAFMDVAFKALMFGECETEEERKLFKIICDVCNKYDIRVRSYIEASSEIEQRMREDD